MNRKAQTLVFAVVGAVSSVTANAATIFFENFESASGTPVITGPGGASEREAGSYLSNVTVPGWVLSLPGNTFVHDGLSGNTSVLLNEGGTSISRTINGLIAGIIHQLTFEFWGDNSGAGMPHNFQFEINGTTVPVARVSTGLATGNFGTFTFDFTPTSASVLLRFTETIGGGPVLDNIGITAITPVPEPGSLALIGGGLVAVVLARRRKR